MYMKVVNGGGLAHGTIISQGAMMVASMIDLLVPGAGVPSAISHGSGSSGQITT